MKTRTLLAILALCGLIAPAAASMKGFIGIWGIVQNTAGDCSFDVKQDKLTISIPGSAPPHDLSIELSSTRAPLVLRQVAGDFIVQVRVDGAFNPSNQSREPARTSYTGAGLVVFADGNNYIRIERATLSRVGEKPEPYTNFEIRTNGDLERIGDIPDLPTDPNKPTWLRLERRGGEIRGAMSQDGAHWTYGEPEQLDATIWARAELSVGVAAISTSTEPFAPIYSDYILRRLPNGAPEVPIQRSEGSASPSPMGAN